jgi:hypothetical protein
VFKFWIDDSAWPTCPGCGRRVPVTDSGVYPVHRTKDIPLMQRTSEDEWCEMGEQQYEGNQ